jgi:hypothetical protein
MGVGSWDYCGIGEVAITLVSLRGVNTHPMLTFSRGQMQEHVK